MPQGQCKSARNWMRRDETRKRTDAEWLLERKKVCERKLGGVCVWETGCGGLLTLPPTSWLATSPRPHTCLNPSSSSLCSLVDWPLLLPWSICPWLCTPQSGLDLQPATFTHTPFAFCDFRGAFLSPLLHRLSCSCMWAEESCWSQHRSLRSLSSFTAAWCCFSHCFVIPHVLASFHSRFRLQSAKDRLPESPTLPQSLQVNLALTMTTQPSWTWPWPSPSHPLPVMVTIITVMRGSDCHELSKYVYTVFGLLTPKRGVGVSKGIFNQWKSPREPGVMKTLILRSSALCMSSTSFGLWSAEPSGVFEWTSTDKPEAPKSFLSFPSRTEAACPPLQTVLLILVSLFF